MTSTAQSSKRTMHFPKLRAESDELLHLDALRFIAALGVVFYHIWEVLKLEPVDALGRLVTSLNLFVDLFFVISGFVISWVYAGRIRTTGDYGRFMHKRVARLWPLHLLLIAGFIGLYFLSSALSDGAKPVSFECLGPHLLMLQGTGICSVPMFNFPSWSISAEMFMYALFPVYAVVARDWRVGLVAVLLVCLGLTLASPGPRPWWEWTHDFGVLRAVPGFLLGMVLYGLRGRLAQIPASRQLVWVVLALFFVAAAAGLPKGGVLLPLIYILAAVGIAADMRGPTALVRALGPAGQLTYSIYMWHVFLLAVITSSTVLGLLGNPQGNSLLLAVTALMGLIFPVAYGSLFLIEKPARRWVSKLGLADAKREPTIKTTKLGQEPHA